MKFLSCLGLLSVLPKLLVGLSLTLAFSLDCWVKIAFGTPQANAFWVKSRTLQIDLPLGCASAPNHVRFQEHMAGWLGASLGLDWLHLRCCFLGFFWVGAGACSAPWACCFLAISSLGCERNSDALQCFFTFAKPVLCGQWQALFSCGSSGLLWTIFPEPWIVWLFVSAS